MNLLCEQSILLLVLAQDAFVGDAILELRNVLLCLLHRFVELIPQLLARINLTHGSVGDDLNFLHAVLSSKADDAQAKRMHRRNAPHKGSPLEILTGKLSLV